MLQNFNNNQKIVYITNDELRNECDRIESIKNRSQRVHSLIKSYGLLNHPQLKVQSPRKLTEIELSAFHSSDYISYLKSLPKQNPNNSTLNSTDISFSSTFDASTVISDEDLEFGIGYDCPKIDNLLNFIQTISGGTVSAVESILNNEANIAINWCGGWHHAQKDAASGFCYTNDIVLGIERLKEKYKKILYIDLDVHHGDGVEQAFYATKKVLTLSFHLQEPGFFPGTGEIESCGIGNGKGFAINAPYNFNITGEHFIKYFHDVFELVYAFYEPEVFVIQCGADILSGDPLGGANLTITDIQKCIKNILDKNGPKIFLGGGGYNPINAAKYWTQITSLILDTTLDEDIPDQDDFFLEYGPCYTINMERKQLKDFNTKQKLEDNCNKIKCILSNINKIT
uniref:Histone deacetylase n=1 Tax=Culicoides sonorensis TaxID=179676 RepID=A0A336MDH4_CULSO